MILKIFSSEIQRAELKLLSAKGTYILKVAYGDRVEEVKVIKE